MIFEMMSLEEGLTKGYPLHDVHGRNYSVTVGDRGIWGRSPDGTIVLLGTTADHDWVLKSLTYVYNEGYTSATRDVVTSAEEYLARQNRLAYEY